MGFFSSGMCLFVFIWSTLDVQSEEEIVSYGVDVVSISQNIGCAVLNVNGSHLLTSL